MEAYTALQVLQSWSTCVAIATFVTLVDQSERSVWSVAFIAFRSAKWTAAIIVMTET